MYIAIFIFIFLLTIPFTQSQNSSLCVSLKNSTQCPAFQSYSINTLRGPKWIQNSTTIESVDKNIQLYISSTPWWRILNINNNSNNRTTKQCSSFLNNTNNNNNNNNIRYLHTIVCHQLISRSRTCNKEQQPVLCNNTCQQLIHSLPLDNNATCFNNNHPSHNITTTVYNQFCQPPLMNNNNDTICIDGYKNEAYCGWMTQEKYCQYCSINQKDTCCTTMQSCHPPPTTQHIDDNGDNDSILNPSLQAQESKQAYSTGQLVSIIIGSIFGCLVLFGCCCVYKKKKKKKKRMTPITLFHWPRKKKKKSLLSFFSEDLNNDDQQQQKLISSDAKQDNQNRQFFFSPTSVEPTTHPFSSSSTTTTTTNNNNNSTFRYTLTNHYQQKGKDPSFYQAIYVNLPRDEFDMMIHKNDVIYLFCYTNEDWGIGYNLNTGNKGLFPLICIRSLTINEVWHIIDQLPSQEERYLLQFRASYFITNNHNNEEHEHDDNEMITKKNQYKEQQQDHDQPHGFISSSDDDLSPITPPATTFHRSSFTGHRTFQSTLSNKNRYLFSSMKESSSSSYLNPQPYYLPLDSFTTLNDHESSTT